MLDYLNKTVCRFLLFKGVHKASGTKKGNIIYNVMDFRFYHSVGKLLFFEYTVQQSMLMLSLTGHFNLYLFICTNSLLIYFSLLF